MADAICFTRGRVKFIDAKGSEAAPTQGQAFFYFGDNVEGFASRFQSIGFIVEPFVGVLEEIDSAPPPDPVQVGCAEAGESERAQARALPEVATSDSSAPNTNSPGPVATVPDETAGARTCAPRPDEQACPAVAPNTQAQHGNGSAEAETPSAAALTASAGEHDSGSSPSVEPDGSAPNVAAPREAVGSSPVALPAASSPPFDPKADMPPFLRREGVSA